jgi:hypothetical protein
MAASGILISVGAHTNTPSVAAAALALATGFVLSVEGPFRAMMIRIAGPAIIAARKGSGLEKFKFLLCAAQGRRENK